MKKQFTLMIIVFAICFFACKKGFLDVQDNSVILAEQHVSNLNATQQYLNGVYLILGKDLNHGYSQIYPELVADNLKPRAGNSTLISQYNWQQIPIVGPGNGTSCMNNMWMVAYQLASSCSFVIEKAIQFQAENPTKANQIKAEAYGIRALVHFILVNVFAQSYNFSPNGSHIGIPYVTTFDWTILQKRRTVAEVYDAITNDLKQADTLFSDTPIQPLLMNKMATKALLARCYLFKEDWQSAKDLAIQVTNKIPLMQGNDYPSKLFTPQETEALFQIAPSSSAVLAGGYSTNFQGRYLNNRNSTVFLPTLDIVNLLRRNPQDKRSVWINSGGIGRDTVVKFPVNVISGFNPISGSYFPTILRSSEMYLTVAEAAVKLGDENTGRIYLDAVRKRADPNASTTVSSGSSLLETIYTERRIELAFEGLRMFDLQRWKKDVKRQDAASPSVSILPYPNDKAIAPIPLTDVSNGIAQNPGY